LVVKEDNYGQNRRYHIWWIVAFMLIYLIPYFYVSFQHKKREMANSLMSAYHNEYQNKSRIFHLGNGDFLQAKRDGSDYNSPRYLLKIIANDKLSLQSERYQLNPKQSYLEKESIIEFNLKELELIDTVNINKDSLMLSFENYRNNIITKDGTKLNIEKVFSVNHPEIKQGGGSYRDRDTSFFSSIDFNYDIMPINIINIEKISGNVEWEVDLPVATNYNEEQKRGSFSLGLTSKKYLYDFKARLSIMYGDKLHKYIVEGNRDNSVLYLEY